MIFSLFNHSSVLRQVGVAPYRIVDGEPRFLIVTSRRTGRWIMPKGGLIEGLSAPASALREAEEEAGVTGTVGERPIGIWRTRKVSRGRNRPLLVQVFPLRVDSELDDWPEREQRKRLWVVAAEAVELLEDPGLKSIVRRCDRALRDGASPV